MHLRFLVLLLCSSIAGVSEPVAVTHVEGSTHGFLVLRDPSGKAIAGGDLMEIVRGDLVRVHVVYRFHDGSVDDEQTVFSQKGFFKLISDHHVQKGPSFPERMDVNINATSGEVKYCDCKKGKEEMKTEHVDLPPDLANGITFPVLKNISPKAPETTVSYLVVLSKPRVIKLLIRPEGHDQFSIAGYQYTSTRLGVHVELGGLTGVVAPIIGKEPPETQVWIAYGSVPAFLKSQGPSFMGGPLWITELANAVW